MAIDWNRELQIWCINDPDDGWTDFTHVWRNDSCVIGWITEDGPENAYSWSLSEFQFRNKPAETKRVKGWVNVYPYNNVTMWPTKELADAKAFNERIACIEIDVPEGHGLEDQP